MPKTGQSKTEKGNECKAAGMTERMKLQGRATWLLVEHRNTPKRNLRIFLALNEQDVQVTPQPLKRTWKTLIPDGHILLQRNKQPQ